MNQSLLTRLLALPALAGSLASQLVVAPEEPRGHLAGIALAVCLPNNGGTILLKQQNDQTTPPVPFPVPPAPGIPVFTAAAMFGSWAQWVDLDAISSGNDHFPLTGSPQSGGFVADPSMGGTANLGWVNMPFSVTSTTTSGNNGAVGRRAASVGSPGGDLFSLFLYGSNSDANTAGIPADLIDRAMFEFGYEHIALPPNGREMVAFDLFLPLIAQGHSQATQPALLMANPINPAGYIECSLYFSVTPTSAANLTAQGANWAPAGRPLRAADVFVTSWNGTTWSTPSVFKSYTDLGLMAESNLTSLAVDLLHGGTVIFTTASNNGEVHGHKNGQTGPVKRIDGPPVKLVRLGEVDAIGAYDPELAAFHSAHGIPVATTWRPEVGISVVENATHDGYHVIFSGWPTTTRTAGRFVLYASVNGGAFTPMGQSISRTASQHSVNAHYPFPYAGPWTVDVLTAYYENGSSMPHLSWLLRVKK